MFTGLVEETGTIDAVEDRSPGRRMRVRAARVLEGARPGDSVAVNGCCLTIVALDSMGFSTDVVPESLARTTLGAMAAGVRVNLERALRLDQRLGGHIVQGHVDGVGEVESVLAEGEGLRLVVRVPATLRRFVAEKGSIAIDGVSLTIAATTNEGCEIALVPHTLAETIAKTYVKGTKVNIEVDLVARYIARLIDSGAAAGGAT